MGIINYNRARTFRETDTNSRIMNVIEWHWPPCEKETVGIKKTSRSNISIS